jgi:hypothetical protein
MCFSPENEFQKSIVPSFKKPCLAVLGIHPNLWGFFYKTGVWTLIEGEEG